MAFYSLNYDLFLSTTESFCHECKNKERLISTHIVTKWQEVWLRKFCPDCGEVWSIVSNDLEYFKKCNDYLKKPDLPEKALTPILSTVESVHNIRITRALRSSMWSMNVIWSAISVITHPSLGAETIEVSMKSKKCMKHSSRSSLHQIWSK